MITPFPPQFFLLLGVDIFLGGSVATVLFDQEFPVWLPYAFDFGSVAGFLELYVSPTLVVGYPTEMQFYYSVLLAAVATLSVLGANLYLILVRRRGMIGCGFAIVATVPSILSLAYFVSSFVNGIVVPLPLFPIIPWNVVWAAFATVSVILIAAMLAIVKLRRKRPSL